MNNGIKSIRNTAHSLWGLGQGNLTLEGQPRIGYTGLLNDIVKRYTAIILSGFDSLYFNIFLSLLLN